MKRNCASGIACTCTSRNNRQTQRDTSLNKTWNFGFAVGKQNHKRIVDTPVRGICHMHCAGETVKTDIFRLGMFFQFLYNQTSEIPRAFERTLKFFNGHQCFLNQLRNQLFAPRRTSAVDSLLNGINTVIKRINQQVSSLFVEEHILLQIRVTLNDPDISQHFEQHTCRTSRSALLSSQGF